MTKNWDHTTNLCFCIGVLAIFWVIFDGTEGTQFIKTAPVAVLWYCMGVYRERRITREGRR